jgi:predicted phosphoadenosine phosphosulfate sulfurtransferase
VHETIVRYKLFQPGEVVAMGASGGKDSTVLAHMMKELNIRHKCALVDLALASCTAFWIALDNLQFCESGRVRYPHARGQLLYQYCMDSALRSMSRDACPLSCLVAGKVAQR